MNFMTDREMCELNDWIAEHVMRLKRTELPDAMTDSAETLFWHRPQSPKEREVVLRGKPYLVHSINKFSHTWTTFNPTICGTLALEIQAICAAETSLAVSKGTTGYFISDLNKPARYAIADTLPLAISLFAKSLFVKKEIPT